MSRHGWFITGLEALLLSLGMGPGLLAEPPLSQKPREEGQASSSVLDWPDQVIILNNVSDLSDFWKKLERPDLILIKPDAPRVRSGPVDPAASQAAVRPAVTDSLKIRGRVEHAWAELVLDVELSLLEPGPVWTSLGLDHQILTRAREGDRELELQTTAQGSWEVRLEGQRKHLLKVVLKVAVKTIAERNQIQLAIPQALSTFIELEVAEPVTEATLGTGEPIGKEPLAVGKGTRLSAHLSPRPQLTIEWSDGSSSGALAAPLLAVSGEVAIDADSETITTRSSFVVRCVRGLARTLELRLDKRDVVSKLQLDDAFLATTIERNVLTIPLGEPMRPGSTRNLVMETRRTLPAGSAGGYSFTGFPVVHANEQSGAIGITQSANLWVSVLAAHGLRRIDPRELPPKLSARPGTSIAFQFLDQPFTLDLEIEKSPPLFRSDADVRLTIDSDVVHNDTKLDIQLMRGRLDEIEVEAPPEVQLVSIGPAEFVESATPPRPRSRTGKNEGTEPPAGVWKINLTPLARDQKTFSLRLRGEERIGDETKLKLGLFRTRGSVASRTNASVFAPPELSFEVTDETDLPGRPGGSLFRLDRPEERSGANPERADAAPILLLRSNQNPASVSGRLIRHPLSISRDTVISAHVSRGEIDVRQETSLHVRHGSVSTLDVEVPFSGEGAWDVQGPGTIRREDLKAGGGERRFRLFFEPPISGNSLLTFRYKQAIDQPQAGSEVKRVIEPIGVGGASGSTTLELGCEPDVELAPLDPAWIALHDEPSGKEVGDDAVRRYRLKPAARPGQGVSVSIRLLSQAPMPPLVAPRALLRTAIGLGDETRTEAWYWIESHPPHVSISLPDQASWVLCRIDGRPVAPLRADASGSSYRVNLPSESRSSPVLVELEYKQSGAQVRSGCSPPDLLEGAVVLQTLWEVRIPWSLALIGAPRGWVDENEWYWDVYAWKRRPWASARKLVSWVRGSEAQAGGLELALAGEQDDSHSYLFGRAGGPVPLGVWVLPRAVIVGTCSGFVLLFSFFLMFGRVRFGATWVVTAALCLLAAIFAHPSALVLFLQSASTGVVLALLGLLIQRVLERARSRGGAASRSVIAAGPAGSGLSRGAAAEVGSDDSTAVRVRFSSTLDHAPLPLALAPEQSSAGRSASEPSG